MSGRESNPDFLVCRLQGSGAIARACEAAQAFGELQLLNDDEQARLCVVIEELVANLYDHGGLSDQDEVKLSLARDSAGVRVTIVDPGAPFDPWTALPKGARPDRGGGVGIDIVKAWALYTGYESSQGANRLEFLLPIHWRS